MKEDRLYLVHIRECITRVEEYTSAGRDGFFGSRLVQDAVLRNLQTLAEPTQRLSSTLRNRHPEIDWRGMAGFRNVLVHDYMGVDLDEVWEIIEQDLPSLKSQLEPLWKKITKPTLKSKKKEQTPRTKKRRK
jgi:uncharacterized protein with HEPN domain